jgi:large subunit ribosomal protein L4
MPKKQRRKALFSALTVKVKDNEALVLDAYTSDEIKTKNAVNVLKNLGLNGEKVLLVVPEKNEVIAKSFRNIPGVKVLLANYVNPYDLLTYKKVLFLKDSLQKIEDTFLSK